MPSTTTLDAPRIRRRDLQKDQTRLDLALAALELADAHGLTAVRVPQIAEAVGVSPRTFNNYFGSKEAAIVWPSSLRGARLVTNLTSRRHAEPLADALVAAVVGLYGEADMDGLPNRWLRRFRALVTREPALQGEYLKVAAAGEIALAGAIAARTGAPVGELESQVVAAMVAGAERAAVLYWARQKRPRVPLVDAVRQAVSMAVRVTVNNDSTD
jgi:AcrR family transcriptional regulator